MWAEPWLLPAALALEACLGYPRLLFTRISHPVVWIGRLIDVFERRLNQSHRSDRMRRTYGVITLIVITFSAALAGYLIQNFSQRFAYGDLLVILVATTGLAQRSLYTHVGDVLSPLLGGDLSAARTAVGRIVGRDTQSLDESGVAAAAIESLAESFNDGVVAPAFWLLVAGLPGLLAYKAINTADSLIGHKEPRWRAFGWAAARVDDVVNLLPARIAGTLLVIAGGRGFAVMCRDAARHSSPNAGWPEAAMAGALSIRIGGAAAYDGVLHERPVFGVGPDATAIDVSRSLLIYLRACALLWVLALLPLSIYLTGA